MVKVKIADVHMGRLTEPYVGTMQAHWQGTVNQSCIHTAQREPHVCIHWHTHALSNSMGSKAPTGQQATKGTC